jgi:hypothetical protein
METTPLTKANATESRNENLTCWRTATNPQCLRVETTSEIHLFAYGYFRHAKFSREGNKDTIGIEFSGITVIAKGKKLEPLCDALARLGVERIRLCPEKYGMGIKEGIIIEIEVRQTERPVQTA